MAASKSNKTLQYGIVAIVIFVALVGLGYLWHGSQSAAAEKVSVIRIGSTAPGHLKFILNQQKGWLDQEFAKDGIKIEYSPFTGGGSEATTALATGSLDFAYTGSNPALRVASSGANVKLVGISSFNPFVSTSIIVKNDSTIKSVKDLKGKKVAYLAGTVRHSSLSKALKAEGLSLKDIESLNMNFDASGPALIRGDIDAVVESDTTVYPLVSKGAARVIVSGKDHPDWATPSTISVNADFARKHPDLVKRVLKIDLQTSQWADAHPEETIKIFSTGTNQSETAVRKQYPDNVFYQDPMITEKALNSLKAEEAFMKENGLLEGSIDYNSWVDKSFIDDVYAESAKK